MGSTKTAARKSVPLTEEELLNISRIRTDGTPEATAFHRLTGTSHANRTPEAETLHALIRIALNSVAEKETELAYEQEARYMDDEEHRLWMDSRRLAHPFMQEPEAPAA